jgi:uncharacterized protein (TIGR00730 family)
METDRKIMEDIDPKKIQQEALGEDEKQRPQPADEPASAIKSQDLIDMMRRTVDRLDSEGTTRGDLKILSRTLRELRYAFKVFQPYRRRRKLTIFGSARTPSDHPAYQQAVKMGQAITSHGWMVITGAGGGIMEAGHLGAGRENSMGLNIMLPFEQSANPIIDGDPKLVTLKYFFTRKLMFLKECSGIVCLPGGFGTLDETLEVLTLMQTGKQTMLPLILLDEPGGDFWHNFGEFLTKQVLRDKWISPDDKHLYMITDSVDETVNELLRFYRRYHSMRYVDEHLVLRLTSPLTSEQVEELNQDFGEFLMSGKIVQTQALDDEANEPELRDLPRIAMHFNRKALGRLREMMNRINDYP